MRDFLQGARKARGTWSVAAQQWRHDRNGTVEFIHINKTGGSSIEKALGLPFGHQTAAMRVARLGAEEWNRRYSFTFVRNPWDRLVSQYHYRKSRGRLGSDVDFRSWVRATLLECDEDLRGWSVMFLSQVDRISSPNGDVLVDDIFRFENLEEDFGRLCRRIGLDAVLPHRKPSSHLHFSEYYDDETADIVAQVFQRDFELLGYSLRPA